MADRVKTPIGNVVGPRGDSIVIDTEKDNRVTTVKVKNERTGDVIHTFEVNDGDSLSVDHTKDGKITTVTITNATTGDLIDTFEIEDGKDGRDGEGSGDMSHDDYDADYAVRTAGGIASYVDDKLLSKVDEPEQEGEEGQALVTDGKGGRKWADASSLVKSVDEDEFNVDENGELQLSDATREKLDEIDSNKEEIDNKFNEQIDSGFLKSKNLFDGVIEQGALNSNGINEDSLTRVRTKYFTKIQEGNVYTISVPNNQTNIQVNVKGYVDNNYTTTSTYNSGWVDIPFSIEIPSTIKYLRILIRNLSNTNITPSDVTTLQIEEGETATAYIPNNGMSNRELTDELKPLILGEYPNNVVSSLDTFYNGRGLLYSASTQGMNLLPESMTWGMVIAYSPFGKNEKYVVQIVYPIVTEAMLPYGNFYIREMFNNVWGEWKRHDGQEQGTAVAPNANGELKFSALVNAASSKLTYIRNGKQLSVCGLLNLANATNGGTVATFTTHSAPSGSTSYIPTVGYVYDTDIICLVYLEGKNLKVSNAKSLTTGAAVNVPAGKNISVNFTAIIA